MTQGEEKWFKKRNPFSTFCYGLVGKFVIVIEFILYLLSMKCLLLDIIPRRLKNSYLDFPLTCILLLGYLLTFRSLFLAAYTNSASIINKKNYMSKDQHEQEKKKKEEFEEEKRQKVEQAKQLKIQQEQEAKKAKQQSSSCCKKPNKKAINPQNESQDQIKTNTTPINEITNMSQKDQSQDKKKKSEKSEKGNKSASCEVSSDQNQHQHSKNCTNQNCSESNEEKHYIKSKYCLKCNLVKDKYDHHCSMCNKCVYRMDHHCFFIGQCVGDYNYLYFISYVFLSYVMTFINLIALIPEVIDFFSLEWDNLSSSFIEIFILILGGLLFHFFTMILLISHLYYISNELTYLENLHNTKKKEHSPLEWICIVIKCQSRAKLYDTFTARWHQIFGNLNFSSIIYPEGTKIKLD